MSLALVPPLRAQQGGGLYVPLGSRLDALALWAIDEGALDGVSPLTRPFRLAAVRAAVTAADSAAASPAARSALVWVVSELQRAADSTSLVAEVAVDAYTNGRRDSFRPGGGGNAVAPAGGLRAGLASGPVVAVLNPAFENRLKDDPEFTGKTDRFLAGRLQEGYVAYTSRRAEVLFGRLSRNWGPGLFDGLLRSPSVYAIDELAGTLRVGRFALTSIAQRLDDDRTLPPPADSVRFNRYYFAHRLDVRLGRSAWLAVTEAGVYGGRGQGFEPAFHAPLNLALLSEFNEERRLNALVGAELALAPARGVRLEASGFLDDIQVDRRALSDRRPASYGLAVVGHAALRRWPAHLALAYVRVSNLAYRNSFQPDFEYSYRRVGLGSNFSDFDQVLLRAEVRPSPRAVIVADLSYLRQGSGDLRAPFPDDSTLAAGGQGFLVKPVRTAPGARLAAGLEPWTGVTLRAELGTTRRADGTTETIAALSMRVAADVLHHSAGAAFPAIERPTGRGWP